MQFIQPYFQGYFVYIVKKPPVPAVAALFVENNIILILKFQGH